MSDESPRFIDLTLGLEEGMMTFPKPWHSRVRVKQLGWLETEGRETRQITVGTHTGTHVDAPRHFVKDGSTIEATPLDQLVGPARLLDLTDRPAGSQMEAADLLRRLSDQVPARLVLRFDWSDHWGRPEYYEEYPYLSEACCEALVGGGLKVLALDTPSPDDPRKGRDDEEDSPNHKCLLAAGVAMVEYLTNLRALTGPWITLVPLPLKVVGADGAPARVIACDGIIAAQAASE